MKNQTKKIITDYAGELYKIRYSSHKEFDSKLLKKLQWEIHQQKKASGNFISEKIMFELSTSRNQNLITKDEQLMLSKKTVAFFGMSVGSHAVTAWMMTSRGFSSVKIIDPDTIDATNLNRLKFGWSSVGQYKVDIVKKELSDINPKAKIISQKKSSALIIKTLVNNQPKVDAIVDEIDDFEAKIQLRRQAKRLRIPLVSAADIGDNIMIDIERYDLNKNYPMFGGCLPDVEKINFKKLNETEKKQLIIKLVGFKHNSKRMVASLSAIGKTIPTWPQLGPTAMMAER